MLSLIILKMLIKFKIFGLNKSPDFRLELFEARTSTGSSKL